MDKEKQQENPLDLSKKDLESLFESTFNSATEKSHKKSPQKPPISGSPFKTSDSPTEKIKPDEEDKGFKSPQRLKYEAEVRVIKKSHGDLEDLRHLLGLSKRKMAQLLLVDPSAWTRWTQKGQDAPPHIYRALQWYLILQDKHPELKSSLWLNAVARPQLSQNEIDEIQKRVIDGAQWELANQSYAFLDSKSEGSDKNVLQRLIVTQRRVSQLSRLLKVLVFIQVLLVAFFIVLI